MEIKLENINYKNKLKNVNYIFKKASITSIIGKSGCGKSLIGLIIMNIVDDFEGNVIVNNKMDYDLLSYLRNVGYVFQNPRNHFVCSTVKEEISFGLKQYNYKIDKLDKQVNSALKMVGLSSSILKRNVMDLSSGEASKVSLASSLVMNPKVLFLDEPTLYLDEKSKKDLLELLLMLKSKYNKTIIIASNDIDFVYSLGGDFILLVDGEIKKVGEINFWNSENDIFTKYHVVMPSLLKIVDRINKKSNLGLNNIKSISDLLKGCFGDD